MFEVTRYNGETGQSERQMRTVDARAAREIADAENAQRPAGSSDHYSVREV